MNSDSDNTRNLLLQLLEKFDPTFSLPSGSGSTSGVGAASAANALEATEVRTFGVGSDATSSKPIYQPGNEGESTDLASNLSTSPSRTVSFNQFVASLSPRFSVASREASSTGDSSQTAQSFNFGEIHAVQERFHSLLQQRLHMEYENKLPLFPWESEVGEYPADVCVATSRESIAVGALSAFWGEHVSGLQVPGLLPVPVLTALFERCQEIARSSSKQGVRLVRAVESLFPEKGDLLEPIADMVLVPAYRSDSETQAAVTQELINVAGDYDSAKPEQQIALSMLAAQEILNALTLSFSGESSKVSREWLTPNGVLQLTATYDQDQLMVSALLPLGGQVRLWNSELEKLAQRSSPGLVDLSWTVHNPNQLCFLEVSLSDENEPLNFSVQLSSDQ